jgi:hypothetical protein
MLNGDDRYLPTLPLAIELRRIHPDSVSIEWARLVDGNDWELRLPIRTPTDSGESGLLRTSVWDA